VNEVLRRLVASKETQPWIARGTIGHFASLFKAHESKPVLEHKPREVAKTPSH
jgi:hypothetical protein